MPITLNDYYLIGYIGLCTDKSRSTDFTIFLSQRHTKLFKFMKVNVCEENIHLVTH